MTLWRCACGWCNVIAESGMVTRPQLEALEADAEPEPESEAPSEAGDVGRSRAGD